MNFKTKKRKNKLLKYINKAEEGRVSISYFHLYCSVTCVVTPGKKQLKRGGGSQFNRTQSFMVAGGSWSCCIHSQEAGSYQCQCSVLPMPVLRLLSPFQSLQNPGSRVVPPIIKMGFPCCGVVVRVFNSSTGSSLLSWRFLKIPLDTSKGTFVQLILTRTS